MLLCFYRQKCSLLDLGSEKVVRNAEEMDMRVGQRRIEAILGG